MRIVATIPHPSMRISVFHMNEKYVVKFEAGPMEQTYKFEQGEVTGTEEIEKILDEVFIRNILAHFNEMFPDFQNAKQRSAQRKEND